jgi:DnaJ-domain-containing protein 1
MQSIAPQDGVSGIPEALPELTVFLDDTGSPTSRLQATLLEHTHDSILIQLDAALGQNMLIRIASEAENSSDRAPLLGQYRVRSCRIAGLGKYYIDLIPEIVSGEIPQSTPQISSDLDFYEVLQVSRQADFDTIRRVFHILAQRYHPDNLDTGSDPHFRQVVTAHSILCDPAQRAAYDVQLAAEDKTRYKIFDSLQSTIGVQAEIRKREGILRILYAKRLTDTHQASMAAWEIAQMLACPLEHLQFAFWMLSEQQLLRRADNNSFMITVRGVETFEDEQANFSKMHLPALPAPA